MTVQTISVNGTRGEITPLMHARVDTDFYRGGYGRALNTIIMRYGPHTRCPGTLFDGFAKIADKKARFLPFEFTTEQVYAIEAGNLYFRFWTPTGQVMSGMSPYEIVSPYVEADLPSIRTKQIGDTVYIFCLGHRIRMLNRLAETNWTLTEYVPKDGPYMDINITPTTLTPAQTGHATPKMTGVSSPSGTVSTSSSAADRWEIFDQNEKTSASVTSLSTGQITFDFGVGVAKVVDNYYLVAAANNHKTDDFPRQWDFMGSQDGTNWVTLDSRDGEIGLSGGERRQYETTNKTAFRYYKFEFSGGGGTDAEVISLAEIAMHQAASNQTPFNLTASSVTGINDGQGFLPTDVGRTIRLIGGDGEYRWCEIKARTSTTVVTVVIHGQALKDTSPIQDWALGRLSDTTGWPTTGTFYEDRFALGGAPDDPIGLHFSVIGDYDNFRVSQPGVADDGISIRLTGGKLDAIRWLMESSALMAGTGGTIRSVAARADEALKTENIKQRSETLVPASDVQPENVENVVLFLDRTNRRIYELAFSYEADGYLAREVSILNEHLFLPGITRTVFLDAPHKVLMCLRTDGKVVAFTYDREQKVAGATLLDFQAEVEDIMVLPGETASDLWMIVKRTTATGTQRHIERLASFYRTAYNPDDQPPIYGVCSYYRNGAPTTTLSGAVALAGKTVGVWADGRDIGDAAVSPDGAMTLPAGISASKIVIGIRMPWGLTTLRLPEIGNQDGSGLGRKVRIVNAYVDFFETAGVRAGSVQQVDWCQFEDEIAEDPDQQTTLRTGMWKFPVDDSYQNMGLMVIEGDRMHPATIRAISLQVDGEP